MASPLTISIVVPNFNGGATLAATLQSLIDQNYPQLQIIVVDGGSTDNSLEIIKRFEKHIAWWVSEKDRGQSHALNKGFARCTGAVLNWLPSDDTFAPHALEIVAREFTQHPELDVVVGSCRMIFAQEAGGESIWESNFPSIALMPCCNFVPQSSCFFGRRLLDRQPPIDETFHYAMDFELWNYFKTKDARWKCIPDVLSTFLMTGGNKTSTGGAKIIAEHERVYRRYTSELIPLSFWYKRIGLPLDRFRKRHFKNMLLRRSAVVCKRVYTWTLAPFYGGDRVRSLNWTWWD